MTNDPSTSRSSKSDVGPDWDALARYLAGESSVEEAQVLRTWLDAHPVDRELVERLDSMVTLEVPADLDVDRALAGVRARFNQPAAPSRLAISRGLPTSRPTPWRKYAVGGLLAAAAVAGIAVVMRRPAGPAAVVATAEPRVYSTRVGQRDSITLGDGSRVILGPDSKLTVPATFGNGGNSGNGGTGTRAVELEGDGYFDVRHDAARPFTVRVGRALVEDVGTTFTVESDAGDATTVSVLSGSVRLRANDGPATSGAVLNAGDRGSLGANGQVATHPHGVVASDTAWTSGRLVFVNAPLSQVVAELRRWYGVTLVIPDSDILKTHYSNTFKGGESVEQVLKVISMSLGAPIDRLGDTAIVRVKHGEAR